MLFVDSRIGSHDLVAPLRKRGLQVEETTLQFGDFAFEGKGPQDARLDIGIELKRLSDLVGSLRSGRLAGHQLPGLRAAYDYSFLVIEGHWRVNTSGLVYVQGRPWKPLPGNMRASELEKHVLTLALCGGLHVRWTNTRADTLQFIVSLYHWFTDKSMEQHQTHLAVHTPPTLIPVSDYRAIVMRLPGIGHKLSLAVEQHFQGSLRRAVNADVHEWASLTVAGKRLGQKTAQRIVTFCQGRME